MTDRKLQKAQVSKKRAVHTYSELWHGLWVLLQRGQEDVKGSKWLWMGTLIFMAFSFEAYLNHIGPKVFACWNIFEKAISSEAKLDVICERLKIVLPKDERPRQTLRELFKFRNNVAHGKTVLIEENITRDIDQYLDEFFGTLPLAIWEEYCTEMNALRSREDIETILKLIHEKVKPKNDPLFGFGMYQSSASFK